MERGSGESRPVRQAGGRKARLWRTKHSHTVKINASGVIPPIFRFVDHHVSGTVANFIKIPWVQSVSQGLTPGTGPILYSTLGSLSFLLLLYGYCFQSCGCVGKHEKIRGVHSRHTSGRPTAEYIDKVLSRITLGGALLHFAVCVLPSMLIQDSACLSTSEGPLC